MKCNSQMKPNTYKSNILHLSLCSVILQYILFLTFSLGPKMIIICTLRQINDSILSYKKLLTMITDAHFFYAHYVGQEIPAPAALHVYFKVNQSLA